MSEYLNIQFYFKGFAGSRIYISYLSRPYGCTFLASASVARNPLRIFGISTFRKLFGEPCPQIYHSTKPPVLSKAFPLPVLNEIKGTVTGPVAEEPR